ncbi:MAG: hypothetical protein U7123_02100 [Potamolinea sp.]
MQLAVAIAGTHLQPSAVHPLSLIEMDDDYFYESTPAEADRLIQARRSRLEELIQSLEPPETRQLVHPIIRIANDVARTTAEVAQIDQANLILVGWHRPAFSTNRLGGRVGQILSQVKVDVAIFVDRGRERIETLLVPYAANIHDDFALELALRLLVNNQHCTLTVLRVAQSEGTLTELSNEVMSLMDQLPASVSDRINIQIVTVPNPIQAVIQASETVDLTIAGTSRTWGIERQTLGRYTDELAIECRSSLLITRRHPQVSSHLSSMFSHTKGETSTLQDESGVGRL